MNHILLFQLKMARDWCIEVAESCPKELARIQMDVFNNTIHWHVGHILTVTERMMFNISKESTFLPNTFTEWFESGTKPTDWNEQTPDLENLIVLLKQQQAHLLSISPDQFDNRLDSPFFGFSTYGECAGFVVLHETLHVGKMEEMLRIIQQRFD